MLSGYLLAAALIGVGPVALQFGRPLPPPPTKEADKTPAPAPTPWFNKDEDTFDLPADPARRAELEADAKQGKKVAGEVLKEIGASKNMSYQERVERIGQTIAHIANHTHAIATWGDKRFSPYHYRYTVLKGDEVNAFSLPGGYIFVYEGLMDFVESDDELAGVLAHETSHAAFRHVATLEKEANKLQWAQIPALIAAMLSRSPDALIAVEAGTLAFESGWSISAEKAADYGGFQFMCKSNYNPVAMLTFMERLAMKDGFYDRILNNTVMQTHPITRERAQAMLDDLKAGGIPILRSKASPAFRVTLIDRKDGTVDALFNKTTIYKFVGADAKSRAQSCLSGLNAFYDSVPEAYQVTENDSTKEICYKGRPVFTVEPTDATAWSTPPDRLLDTTLARIKTSLFQLNTVVLQPDGS
jgi:predicted Zn-dependent protease